MGKNKIGRNDLCPCGSGKKYKHCCMILEEAPTADLFTRCSQMISSVKLKLDDAFKANIKRIRKDSQQNFLHFTYSKQMTNEQESLFSDWLWFDRCDEDGKTFAAVYLDEHQQFMPQPLQECLKALSDSYLSVYEPTCIGDNYLEMRDIFSQTLHQVTLKERLDADLEEKPLLLMGRLVSFPEGKVFSGMVLAVDNNDSQAEYLQLHFSYLASLKGETDTNLLLKDNPEVLFGLFDHTLRKKLINI
ncbi:MAG TPA: SEC-C metal-binding domain-containing protein, partial [Syntrophomonas sp.]|nr:SEC-C metal-binding domain-containing protein [Syntrophomonas sp.]